MTGSTFVLTLSASFEAATSEGERAPKGDAPSASAGFAGQLPIDLDLLGLSPRTSGLSSASLRR